MHSKPLKEFNIAQMTRIDFVHDERYAWVRFSLCDLLLEISRGVPSTISANIQANVANKRKSKDEYREAKRNLARSTKVRFFKSFVACMLRSIHNSPNDYGNLVDVIDIEAWKKEASLLYESGAK